MDPKQKLYTKWILYPLCQISSFDVYCEHLIFVCCVRKEIF